MSDGRDRRALQILHEALALPAPEREPFVRTACGSDPALLTVALELLAAAADNGPLPTLDLEGLVPTATRRIGDFELGDRLGHGMYPVFRATRGSPPQTVALKVLAATAVTPEARIERFHRDAEIARRLAHPHIIEVLGHGADGGLHWIAMELVDGHDLGRELLAQRRQTPDAPACLLPQHTGSDYVAAVARICADAADALAFAHAEGVVHRDVKPQNLLLDRAGRVRVADFGIARDQRYGSLTRTGENPGTPHYMSPEQVRAREEIRVDHRTDVYSLGVVLYELLALARPFDGNTDDEVFASIRRSTPTRLRRRNPRVPRDLELICARAMARSPAERYQTAAALHDDLRRFLAHEAVEARPVPTWRRVRDWSRLHWRGLVAASVAVASAWIAHTATVVAAARDHRAELRAALEPLLAERDWAALPDARLLDGLRLVREAAADPGFDPELGKRAQDRATALRDQLLREGQERFRQATMAEEQSPFEWRSYAEMYEAAQLLFRAAWLFPGDPALLGARPDRPFDPRFTLLAADTAGREVPATASARLLDPFTDQLGPELDLGALPVRERRLEPGYWRFRVQFLGGASVELTRRLEPLRWNHRFTATVPGAGRGDMVRIDAGDLRQPEENAPPGPGTGSPVHVDTFWLDRTEVSIASFAEFVRATNRPMNDGWRTLERWLTAHPDRSDELRTRPAVFVTWEDARAFAEWRGCRLPSRAEWLWAARGREQRWLPWALTADGPVQGAVERTRPQFAAADRPQQIEWLLQYAMPVDSAPEAATPADVRHLLGNVEEWTESCAIFRTDTSQRSLPYERVALGGAWWTTRKFGIPYEQTTYSERHDYRGALGFRCARSDQP